MAISHDWLKLAQTAVILFCLTRQGSDVLSCAFLVFALRGEGAWVALVRNKHFSNNGVDARTHMKRYGRFLSWDVTMILSLSASLALLDVAFTLPTLLLLPFY